MISHSTAEENSEKNLNIISLDSNKRTYGLIIDQKMYLASLVDLPCIIEAQKTLDFRTFYKSVDVAQLLYVHNKFIDDISQKTPEDLIKFAKQFNPLEDTDFYQQLYKRSEQLKKVQEMVTKGEPIILTDLKFRQGLAPVNKNIRNIRFKKEHNEDSEEVHKVEKILKDIIDYGFADNVEEELLEFDSQGNLVDVIKGAKDKKKIVSPNMIQLYNNPSGFGESSVRSGSLYQGQRNFDESSQYSQSMAADPYGYGEEDDQSQANQDNQNSEYNAGGDQDMIKKLNGQSQNENTIFDQNHKIQLGIRPQQQQDQIMSIYEEEKVQINDEWEDINRQYRQLKKLIKETKVDINTIIERNGDVSELRLFHKTLLDEKKKLKKLKKSHKNKNKMQD